MSSSSTKYFSCVQRLLALGVAALALAPILAAAAYRDDIGLTKLQTDLGLTLPTGAGVRVSQVEAAVQVDGQATWAPDPANGEFMGKTITQIYAAPAGVYSGHATADGQYFYGNVISPSPGVSNISSYWVDRWLGDDFLRASEITPPLSSPSRIANHSWVGNAGAAGADALRRLGLG